MDLNYPNYQKKEFKLVSEYKPAGDQGKVIEEIVESLDNGNKEQTIMGVTGSGKTYMMAEIISRRQKPALILAHNKTLAAQLAGEFSQFFPENAVSYFVSYYDYYQPESYIPSSDTYIEKQTDINEEIERLRNLATSNLLTRSDVIIVASVSAIYGLGDPDNFMDLSFDLEVGKEYNFTGFARDLVNMQYSRSGNVLDRGQFRMRGDVVEVVPAASKNGIRFSFFGDELEEIQEFDLLNNTVVTTHDRYSIFPASPYAASKDKVKKAIPEIRKEAAKRQEWFEKQGRFIEAQRIKERADRDTEMLETVGFVSGIENYSPVLESRLDGTPPATLIDFFPNDSMCFVDESHITLPQVGSMYVGDRSRKENLINYGFRLPSSLHNRPLKIDEFFERVNQLVYVSATPANFELGYGKIPTKDLLKGKNIQEFLDLKNSLYEMLVSGLELEVIYKKDMKLEELVKLSDSVYRIGNMIAGRSPDEFKNELKKYLDGLDLSLLLERSLFGKRKKEKVLGGKTVERDIKVSEAVIRPTGLIDPEIVLHPVEGQVDDVLERIRESREKGQRVLITTLTKKFAEELDLYFKELGIRSTYIHFGVGAMERQEIIADLRRGVFDVLIGINLLREGLDIPEVGMVAIFDADKEGFLRSRTSLVQTIGRAARNSEGKVIMYADVMTDSMRQAIGETDRRRQIQIDHNKKHGIVPKTTVRKVEDIKKSLDKEEAVDKKKVSEKEEDFVIESRFSNEQGKRRSPTTDQAYKAFEEGKRIWLDKLGVDSSDEMDLRRQLEKAVKDMDFEKAAAIKDLLDS